MDASSLIGYAMVVEDDDQAAVLGTIIWEMLELGQTLH